jgi:hypothetical protein
MQESFYRLCCGHNICLYCISKKLKESPHFLSSLQSENLLSCNLCMIYSAAKTTFKEIFLNAMEYIFPTPADTKELFLSQIPLINYYFIVEKEASSPHQPLDHKSHTEHAQLANKMDHGIIFMMNISNDDYQNYINEYNSMHKLFLQSTSGENPEGEFGFESLDRFCNSTIKKDLGTGTNFMTMDGGVGGRRLNDTTGLEPSYRSEIDRFQGEKIDSLKTLNACVVDSEFLGFKKDGKVGMSKTGGFKMDYLGGGEGRSPEGMQRKNNRDQLSDSHRKFTKELSEYKENFCDGSKDRPQEIIVQKKYVDDGGRKGSGSARYSRSKTYDPKGTPARSDVSAKNSSNKRKQSREMVDINEYVMGK